MDQHLINRIVEAALLASSQPLSVAALQALFPLDEPSPEGGVERALESLQAAGAARGVELVEVASGWRFQVAADVHPWVARLWTERQARYTRATLETLALIAYRQPITRGEIEQVRGVAVSSNIIKSLEEREWVRVVGHRDIPGRPELLGTTRTFLDYFGLKRLDELPPLSQLKDFGELDPHLRFDGGPQPAIPAGEAVLSGDAPDDDGSEPRRASTDAAVAANDDTDADADDSTGAPAHDIDADTDAATGIDSGADPGFDSDAGADADDPVVAIPGAAAATPFPHEAGSTPDSNDTALADDGDSTGARHD